MLSEVKEAQEYIKTHHKGAGTYAVPTETSKGKAFMKVVLSLSGGLSCFYLFWDPELTISWYDNPKP